MDKLIDAIEELEEVNRVNSFKELEILTTEEGWIITTQDGSKYKIVKIS